MIDPMGATLGQPTACPKCGVAGTGPTCTACGTVFSKQYEPGTQLGSYLLAEVIGEGGMGIVYAATHARLGRRVAIKMLRSNYTHNPQAVHRFFAEARAVNQIHHPNLVEITDFIEQPGGDNYYVMELLQGTSLAKLIETQGILPLERSISIAMQIADVVAAVHRAGIVHRDLKPDNIFLIDRGQQKDFVKLVDFGVAKLRNEQSDAPAIHATNPGAILGTPQYMSPEQASGKPVDHRTDIYAFGALLYQIVVGRLPLVGADFGEIVVKLLQTAPVPPRQIAGLPHEVPQPLEDLILSCLAKQTMERPDSMDTVAERLGELAEEHGWLVYELHAGTRPSQPLSPLARPSPVPEGSQAQPLPRGRRWPIIAAGAGVLVAAVALYLAFGRAHGESTAAQVARELAAADQRIADGRLVAQDGDDALAHLLAARRLDPSNDAVKARLATLARRYEQFADDAIAADSLAEAAAHLQVVLAAEPDNAAAAQKMKDVEAKNLARQRAKASVPP